jgi:hypothetical protein
MGGLFLPLVKVIMEELKRRQEVKEMQLRGDNVSLEGIKQMFDESKRQQITRGVASYPIYSIFLITDIAILLTFGVIFPPLAVVGAVCMCCHVSCLRWNLCRIVLQVQKKVSEVSANQEGTDNPELKQWFMVLEEWWSMVNLSCHTSIRIVQEGYWTMLWIVPIFWSGYLFDMLGDDRGYLRGMSMMIVMFVLALVLYQKKLWKFGNGKHDRPDQKVVNMKSGEFDEKEDQRDRFWSVATVSWFPKQGQDKEISMKLYFQDEIELQNSGNNIESGSESDVISPMARH